MDKLPDTIETSSGTSWRLRIGCAGAYAEGDGGAVYEYGDTGTVGIATGQVHAVVPTQMLAVVKTSLDALGLQTRVSHQRADGKSMLEIQHGTEKLAALCRLKKIEEIKDLESVSAVVEMVKSKK